MTWQGKCDPMEEMTERWLLANGIKYFRDGEGESLLGLDFFLPDFNLYIEVKRFHTDRIARQMARAPNIIAIQGIDSLAFLERLTLRPAQNTETK